MNSLLSLTIFIRYVDKYSRTTYYALKKSNNFKPSVKNILRILNALMKKGTSTKTQLTHDTKLNYTRLVKHVVWMEKKGFVKTIIDENKIKIKMTKTGKEFFVTLSNGA